MLTSILYALAGGALIGLAASALLLFSGRIAGISGIVGGLLAPQRGDTSWRATFVAGLLVGGLALVAIYPQSIQSPNGRPLIVVAVAGALVGYGTRLGNGCTSGHGVCGLTRFSRRSLAATVSFMVTGFITATLYALLGGGA